MSVPAGKILELLLSQLASSSARAAAASLAHPPNALLPRGWPPTAAGKIWEFLRNELEMEGRFKTLESKLNLIQDNLKARSAGWQPCCCGGGGSAQLVVSRAAVAAAAAVAVASCLLAAVLLSLLLLLLLPSWAPLLLLPPAAAGEERGRLRPLARSCICASEALLPARPGPAAGWPWLPARGRCVTMRLMVLTVLPRPWLEADTRSTSV